jgi:hypothetical protein
MCHVVVGFEFGWHAGPGAQEAPFLLPSPSSGTWAAQTFFSSAVGKIKQNKRVIFSVF